MKTSDRPLDTPWRARDREWSRLALVLAAASLVFALWPGLDLWVSRQFVGADGRFVGDDGAPVRFVYLVVPWIGRGLTLAALLLLLWPRRLAPGLQRRWRRRAGMLVAVMVLGVGATVNGGFKEHWGRARPAAVAEFGGTMRFEPPLRPSTQCEHNCSFTSGHAATGFALIALGALGAPATRRRWLWAGGLAGLAIGLGRVAQGGHFISDVVGAGLAVWCVSAAVRQLVLWRQALRRRDRHRAAPRALSIDP